MALVPFFIFFWALLASTNAVADGGGRFNWQTLSGRNFSSQIRLHPHVLLFITVPWSGECRSLMKQLSRELTNKQEELDSLKLMVVFRNHDKVLADSLGSTEGLTVLCYHHGISYKYQGRLRARDILYSMSYLMSLAADELPLEKIENPEDMDKFLATTHNAVLLIDSCEWTSRLLAQHKYNETGQWISHDSGDGFARDSSIELHQAAVSGGLKNMEAVGIEELKCDVGHGFDGIPWTRKFIYENETFTSIEHNEKNLSVGSSCSVEEYQKYSSFFSKFIVIARNLFLPPQRQRFGLVSKKSLFSSLTVEDFGAWALIVYNSACPNGSKILKEEEGLHVALEMQNLNVMELIGDGLDDVPALPIHEPSVILFVDRLADSLDIRKRSREVLDAFKDVVLLHKASCQTNAHNIDWSKKSTTRFSSISRNSRILLSSLSERFELKEKMSVRVIKDGKHVTLDTAGSEFPGHSLQDILTYMLGQRKPKKLSSVAKEAGFQLLSDDIDIKITDESPPQTVRHADMASPESSKDNLVETVIDTEKDLNLGSSSASGDQQQSDVIDTEPSNDLNEEPAEVDAVSAHSEFLTSDQSLEDNGTSGASYAPEGLAYVHEDQVGGKVHKFQGYFASFFFSDGDYQLLRSLTGESEIPRMVIVDPIEQLHYVLPESKYFSHSTIEDFIGRFFNRSLLPYQRFGPLQRSKEVPHPPFVNLDFYEKFSIPCVTTNTFSQSVFGSRKLDAQNGSNPWNTDVLVLFSNGWCGFCQRMELVVREVYRSLKGYTNLIWSGSKNKKVVLANDKFKAVMLKLPMIYRIDCTLNDCSWILKSFGQKELYPSLLLFPAERKNALLYEGDMGVNDIVKFIADHGRSSFHLVWQKVKRKGNKTLKGASLSATHDEFSDAREYFYKVILKDREVEQKQVRHSVERPQMSKDPKPTIAQYSVMVGSLLLATEKLVGLNPFSNGRILVVSAEHDSGFQGLMVNKHIKWEAFAELNIPDLVKEAPLSFGGPVIHRESPLVALTKGTLFRDEYPEVLPSVYFLDHSTTLHAIELLKMGEGSAKDFWFFLGYSGWGWDQLYDEISQGAWALDDGTNEGLEWP